MKDNGNMVNSMVKENRFNLMVHIKLEYGKKVIEQDGVMKNPRN